MATTQKLPSPLRVNEDEEELLPAEMWWRDQYDALLAHGYRLRPRYRPGWVPPWKVNGGYRHKYEDSAYNLVNEVQDATRVSDGEVVAIKRVKKHKVSREVAIAQYLASDRENQSNHCVPVLDHFSDPAVQEYSFLVMPLLRRFADPPFWSIEEVVDFIRQTLEGVAHMHGKGIAHRDLAALNIMMDASSMYPRGFHPVDKFLDPSWKKTAPYRKRRDARGVKYYFIDFGISSRFDENVERENRLVVGIDGQDRAVPELSSLDPYDPFAVDIFSLGNVYRRRFLDVYENLTFLSPVVEAMTAHEPKSRPSADEALSQFNDIISKQRGVKLRWALQEKDTSTCERMSRNIDSAIHEAVYMMKKMSSLSL